MIKKITLFDLLFEVKDPLGKKIRTTKSYWEKIIKVKHPELKYSIKEVRETLVNPNQIRRSVTDSTILLYMQKVGEYDILIVIAKILNGDGFIVTVYQMDAYKPKGELVWQK